VFTTRQTGQHAIVENIAMPRLKGLPQPEPLRRVVVADADGDTRALYREIFAPLNVVLIEAADGRDALVKCLIEPPALLITESRLPGIDGYALCELLRRDRATRSIPIVVVTSEVHPVQLARVRQVGANVILSKPVSVDALTSEVARLCDDPAGPASAEQADAAAEAPGAIASATPKTAATRAFKRFDTTAPPAQPPALRCLSCDAELEYQKSRIGGVTQRDAEQWDEFRCPRCTGALEYRHRTRKLRQVQ
jgi:twitching motility two-component system response regulator PilG